MTMKRIILSMIFFILIFSLSATEAICHRGANMLAPENTFASGIKAWELGAEWVEIDIRRSKDGVLFLMHDSSLNRTTSGRGFVKRANSAYIDSLDAGSWFSDEFKGEKVPRMDEYLDWAKGKVKVYFDIKTRDIVPVMEMIYAKGFEKDSFIWCSHGGDMLEIRKLYPDIEIKGNSSDSASFLEELKPQYYEIKNAFLTADIIKMCEEKGWKILVHELNHEPNQIDVYEKIIRRGVWGVNLDDLAGFVKARNRVKSNQ